jgi:hypothetical protein
METSDLANLLVTIGCPAEKSEEMASQLIKRAHQLAERKNKTFEQALAHLLDMMRQGWSAKERGM